MRTINRSHPHTVSAAKTVQRPSRDGHRVVPRLREQLIADGVVAGYIHDISVRHHDGDESEAESYEFTPEAEAA